MIDNRPLWYRHVEKAFNRISQMPLVLEPESIDGMYEQASFGAEACAMEPEGETPAVIMQNAAERTALAIAILSYGIEFVRDGYPDNLHVEKRKAVDVVKEAYFHDPTVSHADYGRLMEEADMIDQQAAWAAEAAPLYEE